MRAIRFNRYIVECKDLGEQPVKNREIFDLIDTLWNVKFVRVGASRVERGRFNRYIVECKVSVFLTDKDYQIPI